MNFSIYEIIDVHTYMEFLLYAYMRFAQCIGFGDFTIVGYEDFSNLRNSVVLYI